MPRVPLELSARGSKEFSRASVHSACISFWTAGFKISLCFNIDSNDVRDGPICVFPTKNCPNASVGARPRTLRSGCLSDTVDRLTDSGHLAACSSISFSISSASSPNSFSNFPGDVGAVSPADSSEFGSIFVLNRFI